MEFRNREASLSNGSSVSASPDEIPKKPPVSLTKDHFEKMFSFDTSDFSEISDIAGKANIELSPMNYNIPNSQNSYQCASNFPQMQLKHLNAAALTDHTVPKQTVESKLQQIHQQAATIQQKNPSLDISNTIVEQNKSANLELVQSTDLSVPIIWECLKKQDEKWNSLQEQIAQILEQKAVPCKTNPKMALANSGSDLTEHITQKESSVSSPRHINMYEACSPRNSFGHESAQLLNCLQAQTEQIQKLQEQNQMLLEQNMKLMEEKQKLLDCNQELKCKLLFAGKRKSLDKTGRACENGQQTVLLSESLKENHCNTACREETEAKKVPKGAKPETNVEYREEKEKTSKCTMTSFIYNGNDKVVYQKMMTVTTKSKKQCSEISGQCSPKKKELLRTPENRPSPKDPASSSRKKTGKCRKCGKCSPRNATDNADSPHYNSLNASKNKNSCKMTPDSGGKTDCALQTCEEEIQVHNTDSERIMIPRYENILRNVNELNLNCNEVETTPRIKPALKPSSKEQKKYTPPRLVDLSPKTENRPYRRKSSSNTSTTSTDLDSNSDCNIQELSPKKSDLDSKEDEATALSVYGISSPNLSKETRRYLENFGLTRNSRSKTTLVKRYLR